MNVIIANYRRNAKSRNKLQYVRGERVSRSRGPLVRLRAVSAHSIRGSGSGSGPDICKRPAAGASGCGGVPARMSHRSPEHPGRAHYSRSTGDVGGRIAGAPCPRLAADCARTLRSARASGHGISARCDGMTRCWLLSSLSSSTEIALRDHRCRSALDTCYRTSGCAPKPLYRSRTAIDSACVMDTPSQGVHRACLVVTPESSEEASGPGTCRT